MPTLSPLAISRLLDPYLRAGNVSVAAVSPSLFMQLSVYLDLLLSWNQRTNLTAIRDPEQVVQRHFGESLLLASMLPSGVTSVLDLGSGAGFPGIPLQLLHPEAVVTLAESQGKKASFLREVVRSLGLTCLVHGGRAEVLPTGTRFDAVTLRAVDKMDDAIQVGWRFAGSILILTSGSDPLLARVDVVRQIEIPGSKDGIGILCVPRGTLALSERTVPR